MSNNVSKKIVFINRIYTLYFNCVNDEQHKICLNQTAVDSSMVDQELGEYKADPTQYEENLCFCLLLILILYCLNEILGEYYACFRVVTMSHNLKQMFNDIVFANWLL